MQFTLRVPTKDPYAYLEVVNDFDSPRAAFDAYIAITKATRGDVGGFGLEKKDWNRILDSVLNNSGKFTAQEWEDMDEKQRWTLQEIKNSNKRK